MIRLCVILLAVVFALAATTAPLKRASRAVAQATSAISDAIPEAADQQVQTRSASGASSTAPRTCQGGGVLFCALNKASEPAIASLSASSEVLRYRVADVILKGRIIAPPLGPPKPVSA